MGAAPLPFVVRRRGKASNRGQANGKCGRDVVIAAAGSSGRDEAGRDVQTTARLFVTLTGLGRPFDAPPNAHHLFLFLLPLPASLPLFPFAPFGLPLLRTLGWRPRRLLCYSSSSRSSRGVTGFRTRMWLGLWEMGTFGGRSSPLTTSLTLSSSRTRREQRRRGRKRSTREPRTPTPARLLLPPLRRFLSSLSPKSVSRWVLFSMPPPTEERKIDFL